MIVDAWLRVRSGPNDARPTPWRSRPSSRAPRRSSRRPGGAPARLVPAPRPGRGAHERNRRRLGGRPRARVEASEFDPEPLLRDALEFARGARIEREAGGRWRDSSEAAVRLRGDRRCRPLTGMFETAVTWDRFPALHDASRAHSRALQGRRRLVPARLRVPDGPRHTSRSSRGHGQAMSSSSGATSRPRPRRRSSRAAGRSPTTTPSAGSTGRGTRKGASPLVLDAAGGEK